MDINTRLAGQLFVLLFITNAAIAALTWVVARKKTDSPTLLTCCNMMLGFCPPLNILVLARLAMVPNRPT
jgi:hypothetical protein